MTTLPRLHDWIIDVCALHDRYREGRATTEECAAYLAAREDLTGALLLAQQLTMKVGNNARRALRVSAAVPVQMDLEGAQVTAVSLDLSAGGLATLVALSPPIGTTVPFRLRMGRDQKPVAGTAKVVAVAQMDGTVRMSLMFDELEPEDRLRVETVVFDVVVKRYRLQR